MSKNKIIFIIIGCILAIGIFMLSLNLNGDTNKTPKRVNSDDISVWIINDSADTFLAYLEEFKKTDPKYAGKKFIVESFSDNEVYYNTLVSAIIQDQAPDIFVADNRENSPIQNQIAGISPEIISPNDFRVRFQPLFSEDLILTDPDDENLEFLKGVPLGYETLGIFYNRKFFLRPSELLTWTDFAKEVKNISEKQSRVVPLALGNTQVSHVSDIISSLFVGSGDISIFETDRSKARNAFSLYTSYAGSEGDNNYELLTRSFEGKQDLEYFTEGDVAGMVGYPRDLLNIAEIGYQKSFLFATPFPQFAGSDKKSAVKYNYFAINKDSQNTVIAEALLQYMSTTQGQQAFIDQFPYYLSPELAVLGDMQEKKIISEYNIVYKNFVDQGAELVSYDMGSVTDFRAGVQDIVVQNSDFDSRFGRLKEKIICATAKQTTLLNLSSSCE